ncbi:MAG: hypothetical protein M3277_02055 [Actinomycetota bacterium]|nr:hypothetical protein [Actinomycetota bacterium]
MRVTPLEQPSERRIGIQENVAPRPSPEAGTATADCASICSESAAWSAASASPNVPASGTLPEAHSDSPAATENTDRSGAKASPKRRADVSVGNFF